MYVWGLDLSGSLQGAGGVGGLLTRLDTSAHHYTYDGNGNVGQLVDATGSISAHYEYDPFGNTINSNGLLASANPYRFSTKYLDVETDLYYYGYRYYMSELGRWLNRDPKGETASINLGLFNNNNPIDLVDPYGLLAYTAYRSLALPTGNFFWKIAHSAGHVYIAFDVAGPKLSKEQRQKWCIYLHKKGYKQVADPDSGEKEYDQWITFSYHPISVGSEIPNEGDMLSTLITKDSRIDLNNQKNDIAPILWEKATLNPITSDINEEFKLFERIERSMADKGRDFSRPFSKAMPEMFEIYNNYGFLKFNCGGWAKYVIEETNLKWPLENRAYNLGVGVGGPMEPVALVIDVVLRTIYLRGFRIDF